MQLPELSFPSLRLRFGKYLRAHHFTRAGLVALGVAAALVFFFVGAAIRLLIGPVSLGPFSGTLSGALAQALPGVSVKYDQAAVEWSREEGRVELVILGARVFDSDGRIIAQAPKAAIDLAARSVFSGHPEVRRITLVGVQLTLVRTREGGLRLGVGRDTGEQNFLTNITDAITATSSKSSSLQAFAVRDARVAILDEVTGLFLVAPRADMVIKTEGQNLASSFNADVEVSGRPAHVRADLLLPPGKGPVNGDLSVKGLDVGALGANSKTFELLKGIALSVDMSSSFVIDHGAHLSFADFGLTAHGTVGLPDLIKLPIHVKSAEIVGRYDGNSGRLVVDDASLDSDAATLHLVGNSYLTYDAQHALTEVGFDSTGDRVTISMPGVVEHPISFARLALRGAYLPAARELDFEHLALRGGPFSAEAVGKIFLAPGQTPGLELKGNVAAMPIRDLLRYWPLIAGSGARDWTDRNFLAGTVGPVAFETDLPAGVLGQRVLPDGALHVTVPVTGAKLNYIKGLTPLTEVNATSTLTGNGYTADLTNGRIGPLVVTKAHFAIPDFGAPRSPATIAGHVDGVMPDFLALLDQKPLGYPTKFGIDPSDTKGTVGLDISVTLPLIKEISIDQVAIEAKAAVSDFSIALGQRGRLTDGAIDFDVTNHGLTADGTARLGGAPLSLAWKEDFASNAPVTSHITARGVLDDAAREALGLKTAQYLKGPVAASASVDGRHGRLTRADVALDLTNTVVALDLIGIEKPAGLAANGNVTAEFGGDGSIRAEDIRFSSRAGSLGAHLGYGAGGRLENLSLPAVHYGPSNDFSFLMNRVGGVSTVTIRGHSLDGAGIAHEGTADSPGQDLIDGPFTVSAKLDRLVLRDGVALAPFSLEANGDGSHLTQMSLSGNLGHGANISGNVVPGALRRANFAVDDAGQLARGLFGLTGMRGGKLEVSATFPQQPEDARAPPSPDFQGKLTLKDATIQNQPFVARLLSMASFAGIGTLLQGSGLQIDHVEVPFSSKDGVISVHDAAASGPTIGMTADGYIDRPSNQVALKGSLIPVLGVDFNKVLSAIPLFGNLLTSRKGEGVFGVTYSMKGNAEQPSITVNPLAMLTPGILRRVFQGRIPTAPPQSVPPPVASSQAPTKPLPQ